MKYFKNLLTRTVQKLQNTSKNHSSLNDFVSKNYINDEIDTFKILIAGIFLFIIIAVVVIYMYISVSDILQNVDVEENLDPVKIVIPHPNSDTNIDDYKILHHTVKSGDALLNILTNTGVEVNEAYEIIHALEKNYNIKNLKVNQKIDIKYQTTLEPTEDDTMKERVVINEVRFLISPAEEIVVIKDDEGIYKSTKIDRPLTRYLMKYEFEVNSSLFYDGVKSGIPGNVMMEAIKYYSFDVDFQRDIRKGNKFVVLYESFLTEDGEKIRDGRILYTSLKIGRNKIQMYRYKSQKGYDIYFNDKGKSVQKSLLRTPINGARISSNYGMRRHPVLGYSKMHKGMDFAARRGTPFFAAGNGTITIRKRWSTWGNYIRIRHSNGYATEYAHASRFARGLRVGSRVRQGQVIAYVGTTGRSTGPHLHYGVLYKGKRTNPKRMKSVPSIKLRGNDLIRFREKVNQINKYRRNTPNQSKI